MVAGYWAGPCRVGVVECGLKRILGSDFSLRVHDILEELRCTAYFVGIRLHVQEGNLSGAQLSALGDIHLRMRSASFRLTSQDLRERLQIPASSLAMSYLARVLNVLFLLGSAILLRSNVVRKQAALICGPS